MTSGELQVPMSEAGPAAYEVTLDVQTDLVDAVLLELREHHIPAILATGCFSAIHLERVTHGRLRTRYEAASAADVERYLTEHTARLRAEFVARFPTGVRVTREVWHRIGTWRRSSA